MGASLRLPMPRQSPTRSLRFRWLTRLYHGTGCTLGDKTLVLLTSICCWVWTTFIAVTKLLRSIP
jgi:hypothetical protein